VTLPTRLDHLRALDLDGDGAADFAVHAPGLGVAVFVDDRHGSFRFAGGVTLAPGLLRDLCVGDADGDGRSDVGLVLDQGVLVYRAPGAYLDPIPYVLPRPPGVGPLASAAILDGAHGPEADVVAWPGDGRSLVIHPFDPVQRSHTQALVQTPPDPMRWTGPGTAGQALAAADLDRDGDLDLAVQMPDGASWVALRGPRTDLAPLDVRVALLGPSGQSGFELDRFTVFLPPAAVLAGATELEVGVYLRHPITQRFFYWERAVVPMAPQSNVVGFDLLVMPNQLPPSWPGNLTCGGESFLTLHAKAGTRRFASALLHWEGPHGGNGSAIGVRWKLLAAPPLPDLDADLLPWN
jgi:hypothetical protein